jgi:hypothetical protein
MIHAYRLVYPISEHAPPQLWEWEQPFIDHLIRNARTFNRLVAQWYFKDWLPEFRQLIIEVQDMVEEHTAQGTWKRPGSAHARSR